MKLAYSFTALCPYCNHIVDVLWKDGTHSWALHPPDPKMTLCLNSGMAWKETRERR